MAGIVYKYVYRHSVYGVLDSTILNKDVKLKLGDYIRLNSRIGDSYYQIERVRKILDITISTLIILIDVKEDHDSIESQIE